MIEPKSPVTIHVRHFPYPAVHLPGAQDAKLKPYSIILRHRHFKQQYTVISDDSSVVMGDLALRKATRGIPVAFVSTTPSASAAHPSGNNEKRGLSAPADHPPPPTVAIAGSVAVTGSVQVTGSVPIVETVGVPAGLAADATPHGTARAALPLHGPLEPHTRARTQVQRTTSVLALTPLPANTVAAEGIKDVESAPCAINRSSECLVVTRHEHSIRERNDKTVWFSSRSADLLDGPVSVAPSRPSTGCLFVHTAAGDRRQIWLWAVDRWTPVERHHPHPYLPGYVLNVLSNGEPSWVRSETIRTYKGRMRKRQQEQVSKARVGNCE